MTIIRLIQQQASLQELTFTRHIPKFTELALKYVSPTLISLTIKQSQMTTGCANILAQSQLSPSLQHLLLEEVNNLNSCVSELATFISERKNSLRTIRIRSCQITSEGYNFNASPIQHAKFRKYYLIRLSIVRNLQRGKSPTIRNNKKLHCRRGSS